MRAIPVFAIEVEGPFAGFDQSTEYEGVVTARDDGDHILPAQARIVGHEVRGRDSRHLDTVVEQRVWSEPDEYSVRDIRALLAARVPKWQLPERWTVLPEIPKTSVGKYDKAGLRQRYAIGELPIVRVPDTAAAEDI
ncbi:hypothetical protein ACWEO2_06310 [Nocardia sp. NPDC004278]